MRTLLPLRGWSRHAVRGTGLEWLVKLRQEDTPAFSASVRAIVRPLRLASPQAARVCADIWGAFYPGGPGP